jgi:excisionase family DNA binding protein
MSGNPPPAPTIVDVSGAAQYLGTSERFIRRLVSERRIAYHHVGRLVRFDVADLRAYLDANRVEPLRVSLPVPREAA